MPESLASKKRAFLRIAADCRTGTRPQRLKPGFLSPVRTCSPRLNSFRLPRITTPSMPVSCDSLLISSAKNSAGQKRSGCFYIFLCQKKIRFFLLHCEISQLAHFRIIFNHMLVFIPFREGQRTGEKSAPAFVIETYSPGNPQKYSGKEGVTPGQRAINKSIIPLFPQLP